MAKYCQNSKNQINPEKVIEVQQQGNYNIGYLPVQKEEGYVRGLYLNPNGFNARHYLKIQ